MTTNDVAQALEAVYTSLHHNNDGLDACIEQLKASLHKAGLTLATIEAGRLPQNNRQGRKMMQTYFKKRGVALAFNLAAADAA
jgi:hypothetical protein